MEPGSQMKTAEAVSPTEEGLPEAITILGVQVHNVTTEETLAYIRRYMDEPGLHQIATVNPEFVMTAQENATFRQVLNDSDLCLADGIGLLFAGRWQGNPLKERVAGSDLVNALASDAARYGWRLFLLGAAPGVADQAAEIFSAEHPDIQIAGTFPGSPALEENDDLVQRINQSSADLLFVAYGAPAQDLWIARNSSSLENIRVAIGVGGSLDFITGRAVRAPKWIQKIGLEWFYRLLREPWRWKRMLALPRFTLRVLLSKT